MLAILLSLVPFSCHIHAAASLVLERLDPAPAVGGAQIDAQRAQSARIQELPEVEAEAGQAPQSPFAAESLKPPRHSGSTDGDYGDALPNLRRMSSSATSAQPSAAGPLLMHFLVDGVLH